LKGVEREGGESVHLVVGTDHNKLDAGCDLAERADDEFVFVPPVVMCDMALKLRVGNVGEVPDDDVGIGDRPVGFT
jgi:hypothetical protein